MESKPFGSRYLLTEVIGRGAMGRVYRATQRDGGPDVAVKLLREDLAQEPSMVARFVLERDVISSISHPNVVTVHEVIVDGDQLGIVMDLFPAGHLRRTAPPPLPPQQSVEMLAQMASGLAAVHAAGVVHRDLKPENVLVSLDDEAIDLRITDFGIARLIGNTTRVTSAIGTPGYLAPEVTMGEPARRPADVYALGVMLFEWTTGRMPFEAENTFAMMRAHAQDPVLRPEGMPDELAHLLARMLSKDPDQRPEAGELEQRLRELAPTLADEQPWPEPGTTIMVAGLDLAGPGSGPEPQQDSGPATLPPNTVMTPVLTGLGAGAAAPSPATPVTPAAAARTPVPIGTGFRFRPPSAYPSIGVERWTAPPAPAPRPPQRRVSRTAVAAAAAVTAISLAGGSYLLSLRDPQTLLAPATTTSGSLSPTGSTKGAGLLRGDPNTDRDADRPGETVRGTSGSNVPAQRGNGSIHGQEVSDSRPDGGSTAGVSTPAAASFMSLTTPTQTSLQLSWGAASGATGYRYGWTEGGADGRSWRSADLGADQRSATLSRLRPGRTYNVWLTPVNSAGSGATTQRSMSTLGTATATTVTIGPPTVTTTPPPSTTVTPSTTAPPPPTTVEPPPPSTTIPPTPPITSVPPTTDTPTTKPPTTGPPTKPPTVEPTVKPPTIDPPTSKPSTSKPSTTKTTKPTTTKPTTSEPTLRPPTQKPPAPSSKAPSKKPSKTVDHSSDDISQISV